MTTEPLTMSAKERMRRVMRGEKPDRVPVMCQLAMGHIYLRAGIAPEAYWFSAPGVAEGYIRMAERYGFDGILVSKRGCDPAILKQVDRVTPYQEGHLIEWKDGRRTYCPRDDNPRDLVERTPAVGKNIADIDPASIGVLESEKQLPPHAFNILEEVLARKGSEFSIHGEVGTTFEGFLMHLGSLEAGLMALLDDPVRCHAVMERMNRNVIVQALAQCARAWMP